MAVQHRGRLARRPSEVHTRLEELGAPGGHRADGRGVSMPLRGLLLRPSLDRRAERREIIASSKVPIEDI